MNNSEEKFLCNVALENMGEKHDKAGGKPYCTIANQHLTLSGERQVHNTCIVRTAVGKASEEIALSIVELCGNS